MQLRQVVLRILLVLSRYKASNGIARHVRMVRLRSLYQYLGRDVRVLVACEFSGVVRDAFAARGHDTWSCDLLPSERSGRHIIGDVLEVMCKRFGGHWDMMIAFPPCTHLAVSGARWFRDKQEAQLKALCLIRALLVNHIERVAVENPIGVISTRIRKPDQIIQPWQFGHGETKATCLWLHNLPVLRPTKIVEGRAHRVWREAPSPERWKNRSRTYQGIAEAMAEQWGELGHG